MWFDDIEIKLYLAAIGDHPKGVAPLRHQLTRAELIEKRRNRGIRPGPRGVRFR